MNPVLECLIKKIGGGAAGVLSMFALLLLLLLSLSVSAVAQPRDEYAVKAAFVFNFAILTEWPAIPIPGPKTDLLLCVVGGGDLPKAFESIEGKKIGERTLHVVAVDKGVTLPDCQIVFYREEVSTEDLVRTLYAVKGKAVLTIGDKSNVTKLGGAIHFFTDNGKLRFAINPGVISAQGLKLSSRLLKIATLIED
ncbi:YfiR family protein [Desulfopila sp. IMCC35006]|uniref:YfiR family protein n=1 Tax=Desulfopila sp. IMCC35006 TaxID=2569542 RepID=UPI0010AB697A|nr:YfiR family protein [Desulfopila sp. IMCC35006]TKB25517.1 YfiR family protein [Desulfopila sp. IMCC35006]